MAEESKGRFIIIEWDEKGSQVTEKKLQTFIKANSKAEPVIKFGTHKNVALLEFDKEKEVNFLRNQWKSNTFWEIIKIYAVPETNMVKVSNLPPSAKMQDVYRFFTNENMVHFKCEIEIKEENFNPENGVCVLHMESAKDVRLACKMCPKFSKYREGNVLNVEPYYEEIVPMSLHLQSDEVITPVTIDNIDYMKFKFMKDFCKETIERRFRSACAHIEWAKVRNKVRLEFECGHEGHRKEHSKEWEEKVKHLMQDILDEITVIRKNLIEGVWGEVQAVLNKFPTTTVLIDEDQDKYRLTMVGYKDDDFITNLEKEIDAIEPPKPLEIKHIKISNKIKLAAFTDLEMSETIEGVSVDCQLDAGTIKLEGDKDTIENAEIEILQILNQIVVQSSELQSSAVAGILSTPLMRDKIETNKDIQGQRCGFLIEGNTLYVYSAGISESQLNHFKDTINALIIEKIIVLEGNVENESLLKTEIKKIESQYSPYVVLNAKISKERSEIHIVCGKDYYGTVCDNINQKIAILLVTTEDIQISPYIVKYIQTKSLERIRKKIKDNGHPVSILESNKEKGTFRVKGNAAVRQKIISIVQEEAKKVYASWRHIEEEGIHDYFADGDGIKFLTNEKEKHQCNFKIATQYEMKELDVHCIVHLETGQALFAVTGSIANPKLPVDVTVIATDTKLNHKGMAAAEVLKAGGKSIQDDCTDYIKKNGELRPGDIYVGAAGNLPCQRIIHAVCPKWKGGNKGEDDVLRKIIINILEAMNQDKDFILRSLALPLIGVFGFTRPQAAKIILQTMHDNLKANNNVREIFFYDTNPVAVRKIQKQMQGIFGGNCFHLPVRNIGVGKGTMTKLALTQMFNLSRSGSRTLPLPGGSKFMISWGELHNTSAEILVNATPTAPRPSGKVSDALSCAAGVSFDMDNECSKEFRKITPNGNVENGTLVKTMAGRLPCSEIYHIKIEAAWNSKSGCSDLASYIRTCLHEAVRQKRSSIAFPTIGTADCDYPDDDVASVFIHTVADFMQTHLTCSLRDIRVVVNKSDILATSAFEVILESVFSQRPHRLLADIKEKMDLKATVTTNVTTTPAKRPTSAVYKQRNNQRKQNEGSFAVDGSGGVIVDLEVGNIENAKADVIVCTSSSFPKLNGAIAGAIMKAGGPDIEKECKRCYKSYPDKGVAVTKPGKLNCKKVFYTVLKDYVPANATTIYEAVLNCLEQAEKEKMASVAMPTFGTGGFKYPDQVSADETFKAIKEFFKQKRSHVKVIVIVMYGPAQRTCQVFPQQAAKFFTHIKAPTSQPADVVKVQTDTQSAAGTLWKVPNSSMSLEITYGNLELAKADVMLDATTSFPNLNGIIPDSLCKRAGPQLRQECKDFKGNLSIGMVVETKGYNLDCKQVYHYYMPSWSEATGEQAISNCIDDCLQKMRKNDFTSIALPSIGTGGAKYNPKKVADGIYRAVSNFGTSNPGVKCHINLVLYPAAKAINQVFVDELQIFIKGDGKVNNPKPKAVRFAGEDGDDQQSTENENDTTIPTKIRDFVLIQFISDDSKNVDVAFNSIKAQVTKETRQKSIDLKKDKHYDDLELLEANRARHKKMIERMGEDYHVKVVVNTKARKIDLRGIGNGVVKCYERILQYLHERRKEAASVNIGKIVYQTIEWYYTEDNEKIWVPYAGHIKYLLEDAFITKATEKEFRDVNSKMYEVDFTTMEEYVKEKKDPATTIKVIRKDLTDGTLKELPATWLSMPDSENLKEHILNPTDKEYKDVAANFRQTLDGYHVSMIQEIRRIQNRTLYQQYQTKKEQLETDHANKAGLQIERTLWHGTREDNEKSITLNGFNRSYAGATFQNKVWYGMGVYFAVRSSYSTSPNYTPPDKNGIKRMYQVKVLTGLTTAVQRGYKDRYAPLVPGSDIDRFNSTCDDTINPEEFVIFNDTQAYPEYIILFK